MEWFDTIIIGAGPVGLFAGFQAGMRKLKTVILESLPYVGGQLTTIYAEKPIYDLPGFPSILAKDFIGALQQQFNRYQEQIPVKLECKLQRVVPYEQGFEVITSLGVFYTKTLLFASGNGDYRPRKLEIKDSDRFTNIYYRLESLSTFENKRVVVLGGGDSAVDLALLLRTVTPNVSLVHRRNEFRAHAANVDQLRSIAQVLTPYHVTQLSFEGDQVTSLHLEHVEDGNDLNLACDAVLVNYGFLPSISKLNECGVEMVNGLIQVNSNMSSSIKGILAAGNAAAYQGKITTIVVGLGEAAIAISEIHKYLHPGQVVPPLYSSIALAEKKK